MLLSRSNGKPDPRRLSTSRLRVPEPETVAPNLTCAECGRSPRRGEVWRVYFADIGEAVTYCSDCAEREFGESNPATSALVALRADWKHERRNSALLHLRLQARNCDDLLIAYADHAPFAHVD